MDSVQHSHSLRRAPVQQRSAERLTRILDACAHLLDEVGYDELSTRTVALRAEVPIGSVYRFFGNKRAMVEALGERNFAEYTDRVRKRLTGIERGNWRAAFDVVLDEYLAMKRALPGFVAVDFGNEVPVGADGHTAPNTRIAGQLAELLSDHLPVASGHDPQRTVLVAVETADNLVKLAFRVSPGGDEAILAEARVMLRAYLAEKLGS